MELPFYQTNWHDISLQKVDGHNAYRDKVANMSFYESFYRTLFDSKTEVNSNWLAKKRAVSDWIEATFLQQMRKKREGDFRILSVGAGMGIIEEPWIQKGYRVELQECTDIPLEKFRKLHPEVSIYISDAKRIPLPDKTYDLIIFCGVDYLFDSKNYITFLKEINRLIKESGIVLCICFSNLSLQEFFYCFLNKFKTLFWKSKVNQKGKILWGWKRTIGNHIKCGKSAGMAGDSIHIFKFEPKAIRSLEIRRPSFLWARPTLINPYVAITCRRMI